MPGCSVELERLCLVEHLVAVGAGEGGGGGGEAPGIEDGVALVAAGELPDLHAAEGAPDGGERRGERGRERRGRGRRDDGGRRRGGVRVEGGRRGNGGGGGVHGVHVEVGGPERPAGRAAGGAAVVVPVHDRALLGAADGPRARHAPTDADAPLLLAAAAAIVALVVVAFSCCGWCWLGFALAGGGRWVVEPHGPGDPGRRRRRRRPRRLLPLSSSVHLLDVGGD